MKLDVLVNIYNANNIEVEQVQAFSKLSKLMKNKFFGRKLYNFSW